MNARPARILINGFGRIGRLALRAGWGRSDLEFVSINETKGGAVTAAHLLLFDSVQGRWTGHETAAEGENVIIDGQTVRFTERPRPGELDFSGVDVVLECTGKFRTTEALEPYFVAGVRKVIVAAPVKDGGALNVVMGVNDHLYRPAAHRLLTAASCTTNCLAPVAKVLHAGLSLIPTSTGSATAIGLIYPELNGKLNGLAVRVPLLNASLTDCVFEVARPTSAGEVNALLKTAAEGELQGILGYEERPLVSVDFRGDPRSAVVDAPSTMVVDGTQVKVLAWYDNEWGYANRLVELAIKVAASLPVKP